MLSFSAECKQELAALSAGKSCCAAAELAGALAVSGKEQGDSLLLTSRQTCVVQRMVYLARRLWKAEVPVSGQTRQTAIFPSVPEGFFSLPEKECCRRAFLRGAFLGSGSLSDPQKAYHMEFVVLRPEGCEALFSLAAALELELRQVQRGGNTVFYTKDSTLIEVLLAMMQASNSTMSFMQIKMEKELLNNANRVVNAETANMDKIVDAAQAQIQAIKKLRKTLGYEGMPPELAMLAKLRLKNPEASLAELGKLCDPPVSKSCVNHRMKRLIQLGEGS